VRAPPLWPATNSQASAPITAVEPTISKMRMAGDGESAKTPKAMPGLRLRTR